MPSREKASRPVVCRTLGLPPDPQPILDALTDTLDQTYREVVQRLPNNPAVRFETVNGKQELILTPLDELEEPPSLSRLRQETAARMPSRGQSEIMILLKSSMVIQKRCIYRLKMAGIVQGRSVDVPV